MEASDREAARTERGARGAYMAEFSHHEILEHDETMQLIVAAQQGDEAAKSRIVQHNQRLVISIARAYSRNSDAFLDLVSEGNIGMLRALEKFDVSRGIRFSTYATWWIRQGVIRALVRDQAIRIPSDVRRDFRRVIKKEEEFLSAGDQVPSDERIAEALGMPIGRVAELRQGIFLSLRSLDADFGEDGDMHDVLADDFSENEISREIDNTNLLKYVLDRFSVDSRIPKKKREFMYQVVIRIYGVDGVREQSFEEIAADLDVSIVKVRTAFNKAMDWMKKWSHSYQ